MSEPITRVVSCPEASTARFELRCWGEFSLLDEQRRDERAPLGRKARAVIAYLVSRGGAAVSRERLATLLWSERADEQARGSLRKTLIELKPYASGASPLLFIEREHVHLNLPALTSDAIRLEKLARGDDVDALIQALAGKEDRLFGGLDGLDPAFDEWLALERRTQHERLLLLGAAAADRAFRHGSLGAASRLATELQALDETNEAVAQIGMRADNADHSAVRRRYRRLCEALKQELGAAPSPVTEALFVELTGPKRPAGPAVASLAVDATAAAPTSVALGKPPPRPEDESGERRSPAQFAPSVETEPLFRRSDAADQVSGAAAALFAASAMVQDAVASEHAPGPTRSRQSLRPGSRAAVALLAGIIAISGAAWYALSNRTTLATPVVEVRPISVIGGDTTLKPFAARAADQIGGLLAESEVRLVSTSADEKAPLAFSGAVSTGDGQLRLRLTLEDTRSGTTLWSRDFTESAARSDALIGRAEGGAVETINLLRMFNGPSGLLLDPETTMLALRGMEPGMLHASLTPSDGLGEFEKALARRPDSGALRAIYSQMLVAAAWARPTADRPDLFRRAHAEAERTIREHPAEAGRAYWTLLVIAHTRAPHDWVGAETGVDAALRKLPQDPWLNQIKCFDLLNVGRADDSLYFCLHALSLRPHTSSFLLNYAQALDLQGLRPGFANQALEEAARLYPDDQFIRIYRYARETFAGSPDKSIALAHDPDTSPPITPQDIAASDLLAKARKTGAAADGDAAMAAMRRSGSHTPVGDYFRVLYPMALGRMDEAFGPDAAQIADDDPLTLSLALTAGLRRDPRYWPLAARAGLVRYWLTTNKWPDFCSDPSYPLNCRAEAQRVAGAR